MIHKIGSALPPHRAPGLLRKENIAAPRGIRAPKAKALTNALGRYGSGFYPRDVGTDPIRRSSLAGHPPTTVLAGTSLVTTDPDAMTALSPMVTPGLIIERPPIQTLLPMVTGFPFSSPFLRISGSKG